MGFADDFFAVELAVNQRDVLVRADALEGLDLATIGADQQHFLAIDLEGLHFALPHVFDQTDFGECHVCQLRSVGGGFPDDFNGFRGLEP